MKLSLIPTGYKIGAALALAAVLAAAHVWSVHAADQRGFDRAVAQRAASDAKAVLAHTAENAATAVKQAATNTTITKAKNDEIAPVVQRIYVDRVRVGAASCGPATTAKTDDAAGSDSTNPPGRLVREDVERDTRTLTEAVEQDLATGRACQAWGKANGFMP